MLEKKVVIYILAIIESVFFGLTFLGAKIALTELDPIQVLACRWTIAMALFFVLAALRLIKVNYRGKPIWMVAVAAFIQPCIYAIGETCGVDYTTASESSIFYAMIPIIVVLISAAVLKNKIRPIVAVAIIMSFAGVLIALIFNEGFSLGGKALGYGFLMAMVLTGAAFTIVSGRISKWFSPMEITFAMALFGGLWFNGLVLARGQGLSWYSICFTSPAVGLAVLFLGLIGSFLCYILFNLVVSKIPAPQASMLQVNLITLTGVVSGILFAGDAFGWYTFAGLALILAGVVLANRNAPEGSAEE